MKRQLLPLFRGYPIKRYRKSAQGAQKLREEDPGDIGAGKALDAVVGSRTEPQVVDLGETSDEPKKSGGGSGGKKGRLNRFLKPADEGELGREQNVSDLPDYQWVSISKGTRHHDDNLEDMAAQYLWRDHKILINEDFRGFESALQSWKKEYEKTPGAEAVLRELVKESFVLVLVDTVMAAQELCGPKGSSDWTRDHLEESTSPRVLTCSVMTRFARNRYVKRKLGHRLKPLG